VRQYHRLGGKNPWVARAEVWRYRAAWRRWFDGQAERGRAAGPEPG